MRAFVRRLAAKLGLTSDHDIHREQLFRVLAPADDTTKSELFVAFGVLAVMSIGFATMAALEISRSAVVWPLIYIGALIAFVSNVPRWLRLLQAKQ